MFQQMARQFCLHW